MKKGFLRTLFNNFAIVFTIVGIVTTLYFSLVFVPDYLVSVHQSKIDGITNSLISDISKNLMGGNDIDIGSLMAMIEGKEIKAGIDYPYSVRELLVQTQEAIVTNELLPSTIKSNTNEKLNNLISVLANTTSLQRGQDSEELLDTVIKDNRSKIYAVGILGILLSIIGLYSMYYQYHLNKKVYLKSLFTENKFALEQEIRVNLNFELLVSNALKSMRMKYNAFIDKQNKADLNLKTESGKSIYIKSRFWQSADQSETTFVEKFIQLVLSNKANGIFITNQDNKEALSLFEQHNKTNANHKIYMLVGDTTEELKAMLMNSINRIEKDK